MSFGVWLVGRHRLQVLERLAEDRLGDAELAVDVERGGRPLDVALGVVELDREVARRLGDAVERVDEVHVPGGAAELAVGHRLEPDLLLHADDLVDRGVLGGLQALVVERAGGVRLARLVQLGRAQQAPDVVGAERRAGS